MDKQLATIIIDCVVTHGAEAVMDVISNIGKDTLEASDFEHLHNLVQPPDSYYESE